MQAETDKQRMLDMLEAEYDFVHRSIDYLTPDLMLVPNVEGKWSIKDTLAHLTAWMLRLIGWLAEIAEGHSPDRPPQFSAEAINRLNEAQYQQDKDRPLEEILADFHNTYHEVYALIEVIEEEDLFSSTFGGLVHEPIWHMVKDNTYEHFHEHIEAVRKWLAEKQ